MHKTEQRSPFAPAPLQSLRHYYGLLRPCAPRRYSHPCGVRRWDFDKRSQRQQEPLVTWCEYGTPFLAAVENGPLCATQFHPEKSGDAGARLLHNWVTMVRNA